MWFVGALVASVAWAVDSGLAQGHHGDFTGTVDGSPIITVLPKDAIPAIDDPTFVSAKEADQVMTPDEPVLGMTAGNVTKAFSLWQLNHHEIVNDRIETLPIAVTW